MTHDEWLNITARQYTVISRVWSVYSYDILSDPQEFQIHLLGDKIDFMYAIALDD